jgi:RNA polymerase sigma factor (TIGR02999 family)
VRPEHDVTHMLEAWRHGDAGAGDALFGVVYDDLRVLARRQLGRLNAGQSLNATALVHETYLRFAEHSAPAVVNRAHFLALAARAMRHLVIDHIRRRQAQKRHGDARVPLDTGLPRENEPSPVDLIAMDEALSHLEALDARQARIVDMRFFGGLELSEIATVLDISERTIKREWRKARAFLHAALH